MDDLLTEQGQREARNFFDQLLFSCEHGLFVTPPPPAPQREKPVYQPVLPISAKKQQQGCGHCYQLRSRRRNALQYDHRFSRGPAFLKAGW